MKTTFHRRAATTFVLAALACASSVAHAQNYPDKPIRLVVPWPAGGATDQVARIISQPLALALGVGVIVDNKAGAGGLIGTQSFVREKADGYTVILATSSTNAAAVHLYKKIGFDPVKDFTPIIYLCSIPNILVVPAKSPWKTAKEVVDAAKQSPAKYTYGSAGIGSSQHLAGAQFKTTAAVDLTHVPYKGSGPAVSDLMAGHIDMMIDTGSLASIKGGTLRPLAVAAKTRLKALPDVPTFIEAGFPMTASAWYGLMLPANAPKPVVERLAKEINAILQKPEIRAQLSNVGAEVGGGTPEEFSKFAVAEIKHYEDIVRISGAPKE